MSLQRQKILSNTINVHPQSHNLMKFMTDKNTKHKVQGIRCKPKQLFGVSHDSPDHFKAKNTLIADHGYSYQYDNKKDNNNFEYYSQKHFINLAIPLKDDKQEKRFLNEYQTTIKKNKIGFHKRKGRLSQFMDKNGWMKQTYKIMGDQRNDNARSLSNRQRESRITAKNQFLSTQQKSMRSTFRKTNPHPRHNDMIQMLMSEKLKIRKMRNQLATIQNDRQNDTRGLTAPTKFNQTISSLKSQEMKSKILKSEGQNPQSKQLRLNTSDQKDNTKLLTPMTIGKLINPISSAFFHRKNEKVQNY